MFRHGDRAPTFQYTNDPHANAFPEGNGELTKVPTFLTNLKHIY